MDGRRWLVRVVGLLLVALAVGGAFGPFLGGSAASAEEVFVDDTDGAAVASFPDWMAGIPNDAYIYDLSIPGTHDSGATEDGASVEAQTMSIESQLTSGIRLFDIRLKCDDDSGDDVLEVFHGDFYQSLDFEDVLDDFKAFLTRNGSEALLVRVQEEDGPTTGHDCERSFEDVFVQDYHQNPAWSSLFYGKSSWPTMDEARGKIVLLPSLFDADYRYVGFPFGSTDFDVEDHYKVCSTPVAGCEATMDEKEAFVQENIREANARSRPSLPMGITFISGSTLLNPDDVAGGFAGEEGQNQRLYDFLAENAFGRVGGVFMDFPGRDLIQAVIYHNVFEPRYEGAAAANFYTGLPANPITGTNQFFAIVEGTPPTVEVTPPLASGLTAGVVSAGRFGIRHLVYVIGTPADGTEGTYPVTLRLCTTLVTTCVNQPLTITIGTGEAPTIGAESTTVYVAVPASIPVTVTGAPRPTVTATVLRADGGDQFLQVVEEADGSVRLEGTPTLADLGEFGGQNYYVELEADNGMTPAATTEITVTVEQPRRPSFDQSIYAERFVTGRARTVRFEVAGGPAPTLRVDPGAMSGGSAPPAGLTFTDLGGGIGELSGTATASASGVYDIPIVAENVAGTAFMRVRLTVVQPPAIAVAYTTADGTAYTPDPGNWTNQDVTVDATCTSPEVGIGHFALLEPVQVTGPAGEATSRLVAVVAAEGRHRVQLACFDDRGVRTVLNDEDTLAIDKTAPVVEASADRPPNGDGWYNEPVLVTWRPDGDAPPDPSDIDSCTEASSYTGPDASSVSLTGSCTDGAGNVGTSTFTLHYDTTPPVVQVAPAGRPDGDNGWWRTPPVFETSGTDATSGPASCAPSVAYAGPDGEDLVVDGTCTDLAGNVGAGTSAPFGLDRVAPTVGVALTSAPDGDRGWYRTVPTFTSFGADEVSGPVGCDVDGTYDGPDGVELRVVRSCADVAGNLGWGSSAPFMLDRVAPTVQVDALSPPDGLDGWYRTAPELRASGTDATSGVASCDADSTFEGPDGAAVSVTRSCTDGAGNVGSGDLRPIKLDRVAPTVVLSAVAPPDGTNGWYLTPPSFTAAVTDATSGPAPCLGAVEYDGRDGTGLTVSRTCWDVAGNQTTATFQPFELDRVAPTVTCPSTPTFLLRATDASLEAAVADELSGPVAPTVGGIVPVDTVGSFVVNRTGADVAGNQTTVACPYLVTYGLTFLYDGVTPKQQGSTVPIKVQLVDATGANVSDPSIVLTITGITPEPAGLAPVGETFVPTTAHAGAYQYDLRTARYGAGTYTLEFTVTGDPVVHSAPFALR